MPDFEDSEFSEDEFDRDITSGLNDPSMRMMFAFAEIHEAFLAMLDAGFTEVQALRFLAFCAIYEGDV